MREGGTGVSVKELCRLSEASYYLWRSKFSGLEVLEARRLKVLEQENARLKLTISSVRS